MIRQPAHLDLLRFFREVAPLAAGDRLVVALSAGPDSLALLHLLCAARTELRVELFAAHLDHGMDPDSGRRAAAARAQAAALRVPFEEGGIDLPARRGPGESLEEAARRERYAFLEAARRRLDGRYVATAHHRDDQAETVVLRLLYGSGLEGLAGIQPRIGAVVRPVLHSSRAELHEILQGANPPPVTDPTNRDLRLDRNRVRQVLLPGLEERAPGARLALAGLAESALGARTALERRLGEILRPENDEIGLSVERRRLEGLPPELLPYALALLHRRAGAPYPSGLAPRDELRRQLAAGGAVGCDCGDGWRWEADRDRFRLLHRPPQMAFFSYTFGVPGEVAIPEIGIRFQLRQGTAADWMFRPHPERVGLALPLRPGDRVEVRNRRPGDRLQPFGRSSRRRLKSVLIEARVPRRRRDRLPLLCVGNRIAWVPGVTIEERFRLGTETQVWIAEIQPG